MTRRVDEANILVLNYNGKALMEECLPSIVMAASRSRRRVTVTVLDNVSVDDSITFLKEHFPSVRIVLAEENRILCSYNEAVRNVQEPVVILLNNDIKVDLDFVDPLLDPFEKDPDLFSVGCKCLGFDAQDYQGEKSIAGFRYGFFWTDSRYPGSEADHDVPSWTAQVAFGAFDREKFLTLGGYDDLYLPGTWEDTDISLQAYRRGWHCFYEPKSIVYHKGQVSFHKEFGKKVSSIIAYRNSFLFVWKNFKQGRWAWIHWFFLPLRLLAAALMGNFEMLQGFKRAWPMRRTARARSRPATSARSDEDVLRILSDRRYPAERA